MCAVSVLYTVVLSWSPACSMDLVLAYLPNIMNNIVNETIELEYCQRINTEEMHVLLLASSLIRSVDGLLLPVLEINTT